MTATQRSVEAGVERQRLDRWFRTHYPDLGFSQLNKLLRTGQIRVDGKRAKVDTRLSSGQVLRIPPLSMQDLVSARKRQVKVPLVRDFMKLEEAIVYEDTHMLALNKPAGLAVQGGTGITKHLDAMMTALRPQERPKLAHRIDKDTSGLVLMAKTQAMAHHLTLSFKKGSIRKIYWALVTGRPPYAKGNITAPLRKQISAQGEKVVIDHEQGLHAESNYQVIDRAGKRAAWLSLEPKTGRTHQLRVHCLSLGTPILGDYKYGGAKAGIEGLAQGLHLHAREIFFDHPHLGPMRLSADMPAHMQSSFSSLGFNIKDAKDLQEEAPWL